MRAPHYHFPEVHEGDPHAHFPKNKGKASSKRGPGSSIHVHPLKIRVKGRIPPEKGPTPKKRPPTPKRGILIFISQGRGRLAHLPFTKEVCFLKGL